jgi:NO-binding membrane sensor protein with MHYT domain
MFMHINEFSYGLVTPALGFAMSLLGAFLGLRSAMRARACDGWARARWLLVAGISLGLGGVWVGHFIDMLGFSIPDATVRYSVAQTLASALLVVAVMCVGLFIAGYSDRVGTLLLGGLLVGLGIASMHYTGMAAMRMPGAVSYDPAWLLVSSAIAVLGGIAALWSALRLRGTLHAAGGSLIIAAAVGGMHYAGMAAMRMSAQPTSMAVEGATVGGFLLPVVLAVSILTIIVATVVALAPDEDEMRADTALEIRIAELERQLNDRSRAWPPR